MGDKLKQSLYFPDDALREIMKEATRLDRSLSWTVQQAWRLARTEIRKFPSADRRGDTPVAPARERPAESRPRADGEDRAHASAQVREFLRGKFDRELTS
jgi:uncharacterized small protein (TIGR04563 family)